MSRRHGPATEGELDRLEQAAVPPVVAVARGLSGEEDDALQSPDREEVLHQLGVLTIRRRDRGRK